MPTIPAPHPSSYRDPSGFVFEKNGVLYRQVNIVYKENYDRLIQSGCHDHLVKSGWLIPHEVVTDSAPGSDHYVTIKPERVAYISYPYEWSFEMLKDAALLTLGIAKESLNYGMILKDASPYNIQWHHGRFIFIDTLSFEKFEETPWIAYRQFCENFLGPLLIMHYAKKQMPGLLLAWPDGIPLDIVKSLLPKRSRFSLYTYLHIHLNANLSQKKPADKTATLSKEKLVNVLASLEGLVNKLKLPSHQSVWSGYYEEAEMRDDYLAEKKSIVDNWVNEMKDPITAADLGANEGEFSKQLAAKKIYTIAADMDPWCIHRLYQDVKIAGEKYIQPLVIDLANPSPAIGLNNEERDSFTKRVNTDLLLALALVHHLAIGKNIPLSSIAQMFCKIAKKAVVEFIPKEDEKVQLMLQRKKDIYTDYDESNFVTAFEKYFTIIDKKPVARSGRTLYLMQRNS
jgi:hypothetical protein